MRTRTLQVLLCFVALCLLAVYAFWLTVVEHRIDGLFLGMVIFVPFVFTASLLLCYMLGLGKGPPGPDN